MGTDVLEILTCCAIIHDIEVGMPALRHGVSFSLMWNVQQLRADSVVTLLKSYYDFKICTLRLSQYFIKYHQQVKK